MLPAGKFSFAEVSIGRQRRRNDYPCELIPVEERKSENRWLSLHVERRYKEGDVRRQQEQIPQGSSVFGTGAHDFHARGAPLECQARACGGVTLWDQDFGDISLRGRCARFARLSEREYR